MAYVLAEHRLRDSLLRKVVAYVRHVESLDGMDDDYSQMAAVVDFESSDGLSFPQDVAKQVDFSPRHEFARTVHLAHVAEEAGPQRAVAAHDLAHGLETARHILFELAFWRDIALHYFLKPAQKLVGLPLYDGIEDVALALEVGVDGAASLVGSRRDIVHSGVFHTFPGEKLTGHLYEFIARFLYHSLYGLNDMRASKMHTIFIRVQS